MEENKKFLDYEGFKSFYNKLAENLRNLNYDPQRKFESKTDLLTKKNWNVDEYGQVKYGLKEGLVITVGDQIWQLVSPSDFQSAFKHFPAFDPDDVTAADLGWNVVGSTTEFNVEGHTLKLYDNKNENIKTE